MGETFLGGVASLYIGRLANDALRDGFRTQGYGIYFTDSRLIGVSYRKITSRAFRLGYVFSLVWIVSLSSVVAYIRLTGIQGDQPLPFAIVLVPLIVGSAALAFVFLVYLSPRQAGNRIQQQEAKSLLDLANQSADLVLERTNISQVMFQFAKISVLMKSGEWYFFRLAKWGSGGGYSRKRAALLLGLFQNFCSQNPPINMWIREKKQWRMVTQGGTPSATSSPH